MHFRGKTPLFEAKKLEPDFCKNIQSHEKLQKMPFPGVEGGKVDLNLRKTLILRDLVKNGAKKRTVKALSKPEIPLFLGSKSSKVPLLF